MGRSLLPHFAFKTFTLKLKWSFNGSNGVDAECFGIKLKDKNRIQQEMRKMTVR